MDNKHRDAVRAVTDLYLTLTTSYQKQLEENGEPVTREQAADFVINVIRFYWARTNGVYQIEDAIANNFPDKVQKWRESYELLREKRPQLIAQFKALSPAELQNLKL